MKIVEMLRLSELGMSQRQIAHSSGCGKTTVGRVLKICQEKSISYSLAAQMTDDDLHVVMYPESLEEKNKLPQPDWQAIHEELVKHKNLNLHFMWEEYRKATDKQVSLYNERKADELMEVDWMKCKELHFIQYVKSVYM